MPILVDTVLGDGEYVSPRVCTGRLKEPEGDVEDNNAALSGDAEDVVRVSPRLDKRRIGDSRPGWHQRMASTRC